MEKQDIKIVEIRAMKAAVFTAVSSTPENDAFKRLLEWTTNNGISDFKIYPVYGFERPDLYQGESRAYTLWVSVPHDLNQVEDVKIIDVPGGLYASIICETCGDPGATIPSTWLKLDKWVKERGYKKTSAPCLERYLTSSINADFTLELLYPIE